MPASGTQFEINHGGYRAVVTESGGALRTLSYDGRDLVDGFAEDEMSPVCRGQLLMPWPNRIRDGRYTWGGVEQQLPLTEPSRHNASHGLVRWVAWTVASHTDDAVELTYRLMAQSGYPWTLDLSIRYELGDDGLTVTQGAVNRSAEPAPYAQGAHPYLMAGPAPVDTWELLLPASTRSLSDPERLLPIGREDVTGTEADFRTSRPMGDVALNHAFTDLVRDDAGHATTVLRDPGTGHGVELWVDEAHGWLMLYTADDQSEPFRRRSVAVEPMTAQVDAFRSGEDVVTLAGAGAEGDRFTARWGIRA
jgi:aldose 1-epimerase